MTGLARIPGRSGRLRGTGRSGRLRGTGVSLAQGQLAARSPLANLYMGVNRRPVEYRFHEGRKEDASAQIGRDQLVLHRDAGNGFVVPAGDEQARGVIYVCLRPKLA